MTRWQQEAAYLEQHGLYHHEDEHDACGVGFVAAIDGTPRRSVMDAAIQALKAVWHRGAVDADGKTGDGAGIHFQISQPFFRECVEDFGRVLAPEEPLAVGMIFLPRRDFGTQEECRMIVEQEILRMGYDLLGWRQVPVNPAVIGEKAAETCPEISQILIRGKKDVSDELFERDLYLIRRRIEKQTQERGIPEFYICSLSCRSIIYKGLFKAEQLEDFYPDLKDKRIHSRYAIFHQRFSTNTAPQWHLAQPFRCVAHNGEINTVRGNSNWMKSHEATMHSPLFMGCEDDLRPVIPMRTSDTGALDAVMELFIRAGRPAPLAKLILIPPAWANDPEVPEAQAAMYSYHGCLMSPWDGPAALAVTDGRWITAGMDRNGLRPMRYKVTRDGLLVVGSESGMVPLKHADVEEAGRLGPGQIIGVDLDAGRLYHDRELKDLLAAKQPYADWARHVTPLASLPAGKPSAKPRYDAAELRRRQIAVGISMEDLELVLHPMVLDGKEGLGSMGDDTPLAVLAKEYRGLHHFFRQNFSQVTNPPIDSLRERKVMGLDTRVGNKGNVLEEGPVDSRLLVMDSPLLLAHEFTALARHVQDTVAILDATFDPAAEEGLRAGIDRLIHHAFQAITNGQSDLILSDEASGETRCGIPMILAVSALHQHLVRRALRKQVSILVKSAECLDVHHLAVLIGVGATAVHPYLAEETIKERHARHLYGSLTLEDALQHYKKAASDGLLKTMSKMGISVAGSYRGGKNFEAIGLSRALVAEYFPGLSSRISGIGLKGLQARVLALHQRAFATVEAEPLPIGGFYRYRAGAERHAFEGTLIHLLQHAVTKGQYQAYKRYAEKTYDQPPVTIRDLLAVNPLGEPVPLEEVESVSDIRKRFIAPAMSLGALSKEAHETLAIAMNRMGAGSNSGEGGEDRERFTPRENGDNANSTIKQVASARFGVTAHYLNHAKEIQIKVAQGAKPGEGGQLPGFKVTMDIARLRHATEGVTLISPPPHHDIYSIEDLAQLIYDLKQINPEALVSVKLVAQSGIGTVASGVAKAMADKIIISGHAGGTGASPYSSIKHAGVPWEMGLAEAQQVLTLNRLRHRVTLQTDGGLKTGRDIVMAAILGAEEYAIGTAALVAMGCLLVRQCHSNTCPVGICTQDEALRAKFDGTVEKVIHLFSFIAEEVREILASLGVRSLNEIIGRVELLHQVHRGESDLDALDLGPLLVAPNQDDYPRRCTHPGRNDVPDTLDAQMLKDAHEALERGERIQLAYTVANTHRSVGTRLSSMMTRTFATESLQPGHITVRLRGSAGQSLGAFAVNGLKLEVLGDANDYVGKGLSGGRIVVRPLPSSQLATEKNTIIGNTVLYGATAGELYAAGQAGERFAVRNSGALAVVEGCGSNGCEYMTGGTAVILGEVGHNFGAGMTGGMAFVYDPQGRFPLRVNGDSVSWQRLASAYWEEQLQQHIAAHVRETESIYAENILNLWRWESQHFWHVCPKEMIDRLDNPLTDSVPVRLQG